MSELTIGGSPTVRRRRLGAELRRLREQAGLSADDAARHLECSPSKISRVETGRTPARVRDVRDLLDLYLVHDTSERGTLLDLVRQSKEQGWWQSFGDAVPDWLETLIGLEGDADTICTYESVLVPGLLQTEEYTRALAMDFDGEGSPSEAERTVALKRERQKRRGQTGRLVHALLDEAVLHRPVGGPEVLRGQLEHLLAEASSGRVVIGVIPFRTGGYPAQGFPFTLFEFPDTRDQPVVYLEALSGAVYLEKAQEVRRYKVAFDKLRACALGPDEAGAMITRIVEKVKVE
ncbi:helix-turn-helix transcriptional regulator [Parafrankia sp. EUN1f]|uniref:helix-turn-helix domain-containing protein n=1 Tax=Parafrankia sp. EUN1f TaxID=102897 RepID=UPI0001C4633D|nr:helix-turn-helix transcriptional regulator [Parafrankia sp. EUN1f]EFC81531.1 transcriptional regulator, XRE family [Parafrankia sp. EUN1f]